jgi:predicted nucleic acid-binding protein
MRIIISDSSCLIDLRKAALLAAFLQLPYEILIPDTLFEEELLRFTDEEKTLLGSALKVMDLPGKSVLRAQQVARDLPHLSIHDGFAFALAEDNPGCILLTADGDLRDLAEKHHIVVHGVLWVIDEIHANGLAAPADILTALRLFATDVTVRLPRRVIAAYIKRFEGGS